MQRTHNTSVRALNGGRERQGSPVIRNMFCKRGKKRAAQMRFEKSGNFAGVREKNAGLPVVFSGRIRRRWEIFPVLEVLKGAARSVTALL